MTPTPSPCGKLGDGSRSPVHLYYESCDCAACARARACDRAWELERARGRHYYRKQEQMERELAQMSAFARAFARDFESDFAWEQIRVRAWEDDPFSAQMRARAYARDFESDFAWEQIRVRAWEDDPFRAQMRARDREDECPYIPPINWQHRRHVEPEPNLRKRWRMYVDPVFPQFPSHPSWMHQQPLYPTPEFPYKPQHHKSQCR
jgi:hypothetical protein